MVITTELSDAEKRQIRDLYQKCVEIKKNFPFYVNMNAINEKIWLFHDLFGENFFK